MRGKLKVLLVFALVMVAVTVWAYDYGWIAHMNGSQEVPPTGSPATGTFTATVTADCDSFVYVGAWGGLSAPYTASHVHKGVLGQIGGVVHPLQNANGAGAFGAWSPFTAQNRVQLNSESLYVNVHTQAFPGGEIRGQIICQPDTVNFDASQVGVSYCIQLCPVSRARVRVFNVPPGFYPVLTKRFGCSGFENPCDVNCCPTSYLTEYFSDWQNTNGVLWIELGGNGCLCVTLEAILAVEMGSFDAVEGDGQVTLNWSTRSETNNDRFEILRNNELVTSVAGAGNSSSGSNYSWTDHSVVNGTTYSYTLYSVDVQGNRAELATASATPAASVVSEYALDANYPNPFNPETRISFELAEAGYVTLSVYDLLGREVATLVNSTMGVGRHAVSFEGADLPSGLYIYRLDVNGFADQKKMLLLK